MQQASFDPRFDIHSQCAAAGQQGADVLVENEEGHLLAALAGGVRIGQRQRGLADPGRADQQRVGAAFQPATEHPVQHLVAGGGHLADEAGAMLGRDQARIDLQPALADDEVVVATAELDAAHLDDPQTPAFGAIVDGQLLQQDDPMGNRVQLQVAHFRGLVIEQDHRAAAGGEEVLECQHLPAIAQRALRQQSHFRKAVEDHPCRVGFADAVEHLLGGFAELHFRRVQHGQLQLRIEAGFRADQFEHINAIQAPAVPLGHQLQLCLGFRQRHVEHALAPAHALEQELQRNGGLARARTALVEIHAVGVQAAAEDVVQAFAARRNTLGFVIHGEIKIVGIGHFHPPYAGSLMETACPGS